MVRRLLDIALTPRNIHLVIQGVANHENDIMTRNNRVLDLLLDIKRQNDEIIARNNRINESIEGNTRTINRVLNHLERDIILEANDTENEDRILSSSRNVSVLLDNFSAVRDLSEETNLDAQLSSHVIS